MENTLLSAGSFPKYLQCQELRATLDFLWVTGTQPREPSPPPSRAYMNAKLKLGTGAGNETQLVQFAGKKYIYFYNLWQGKIFPKQEP